MNITASASCSIEPDSRRSDELRPLVLAAFDRPRKLRQREHRHRQFLGDRLQTLRDLADFQHAVFRPGTGRRAHQLQIVDDDQRQPLGALQPAAAGAQRGQRDRRRIVDIDRQAGDLPADLRRSGRIPAGRFRRAGCGRRRSAPPPPAGGWRAARRSFRARTRQRPCLASRRRPSRRCTSSAKALAAPKAIFVASAVLPMPGRPARISRSDGCSPPVLLVEVAQAGGEAGDVAGALERPLRAPHRFGERLFEGDEAAIGAAIGREAVQRLLGRLDLRRCRQAPDRRRRRCSPPSRRHRSTGGCIQASWTARPYSPALMMPTIAVRSCAR